MDSTQYFPDLTLINTWLCISGVILIGAIYFSLRFLKPQKAGTGNKFRQLYFLLFAFSGLLAFTVFAFMLFNRFNTGPVELNAQGITLQGETIPLNDIRSTKIHREGNGNPFQGMGVDNGSKNSLIIEYKGSKAKLLSEDFYPIQEIAKHIKKLKGKQKDGK